MKNAGNKNTSRFGPEEHKLLTLFHAAQAGANMVARSAQRRAVGQLLATRLQVVEITDSLVNAPCPQGEHPDIRKV